MEKNNFNFFSRLFDKITNKKVKVVDEDLLNKKTFESQGKTKVLTPGRQSESEYTNYLSDLNDYVKPEWHIDYIPKLRALTRKNENLGSVFNDLIQLTNTGHYIKFNQNISEKEADLMRKHLIKCSSKWGSGVHGIEGLINKWIAQVWISGALSNEWVINKDLNSVLNSVLVNPENIRFKYNRSTTFYEPYQWVKNKLVNVSDNFVKLNTNTYFYAGILGDTDLPYGIPPFITAIKSIGTQGNMRDNIDHILEQLGLLGYLEVKLDKPLRSASENEKVYEKRLENLLIETKKNVKGGFKEGVVVGYQDDHEFQFHSTTKNLNGVAEVFNLNEVIMANGLKTSPSFIGQKSSGTETNLGIVFTKMLSQLKNVQQIISSNLIKGYILELNLAGFNIKEEDIKVEFKTSTISDDLKLWQGREIKQRVLRLLFLDGIISKDVYAEELGYDKPYSIKPVIPYETPKVNKPDNSEEKDQKNKSARRTRDKDKKQTKRKDTNTKPQ
jgi:hypothetical protein